MSISNPRARRRSALLATAIACAAMPAGHAAAQTPAPSAETETTLPTVRVEASADASAQGLSPAYPGGDVSRGARLGILGTTDYMEAPFSATGYTNELIRNTQSRSVGEVLLNDPTVRVARGFGNFQESYFIRGFILNSDDVAFNGLYSLLPRQYIATELFERVEVLRGASAFLNGANPGGGGIGGAINLVPKRAPSEPLNRVTVGTGDGGWGSVAMDFARRLGPDGATGVRVNAAYRDGGTSVDNEGATLGLLAVGLDWRSDRVRLSADLGYQDNRLRETRPSVTLGPTLTAVPAAPNASSNFAQPWTYSNEKDLFGTLRGEADIGANVTAWAAYGGRRSDESNSLANPTATDAATGAAYTTRFDNARKDRVDTGELGLRGKARTGSVGHEWVASAAYFRSENDNAYAWDFFNQLPTNLYNPISYPQPGFTSSAFTGNDLGSPSLTTRTQLTSFALGDTLAFLDARLLATVGARYQKYDLKNFAYNTGAETSSYDESRTSPALGLVYRFNPRFSAYANYIEGLSQGETAPAFTVNSGEVLAPYVSKQTEVGLKADTGRLGGSIALFSTTKPRSIVTPANVFTSEGEDLHRGVELLMFGEVTRDLRILGGATWLDAKQEETGVPATEGNRVIGVPSFQANLGAEWTLPGVPSVTLDGRVIYTGSSYANDLNTLSVPSWTRLDLGVRWLTELNGKLVTLRARVDNVTNADYWASAGGYPGQGYLVLAAPRTFLVSLQVDL